MTADHSTVSVSPFARRKAPPFLPLRTKTRSTSQSRRAGSCCTARSRTVTSSPVSTSVTRRSSSSPKTSRSVGRCSKRRTFSTPVVMTCPDSMLVTRVMGRKMRRRVDNSTTSPRARGGRRPTRSMTTRSRTRPTWSPVGSKTGTPARCETKIRGAPAAMAVLPLRGDRVSCSDMPARVRFRLARPVRIRPGGRSGRTGSAERPGPPVPCGTPLRNRQKGDPTCDCDAPGPYPPDRAGDRDLRTGRDGSDGAVGVRR